MTPDQNTHRRRPVLKAIGGTSAVSLISGIGAAKKAGKQDEQRETEPTDNARPPIIHSHFGYSGTSDDDIPERLTPDETVELHVDEEKIVQPEPPDFDLTVEFGAFHFAPLGLQVEPGAIVEFDFHTPEHTATAYHPGQERQQRVPDGVPAFSSTVNEHHGFWLYRFEKEGVYDLFCSPHEWGGMGMRIVVGDDPGPVARGDGRPPLPLTAALLGSGLPPEEGGDPDIGHEKLAPRYIIDNGPISLFHPEDENDEPEGDELEINLEVTLTGPNPPES